MSNYDTYMRYLVGMEPKEPPTPPAPVDKYTPFFVHAPSNSTAYFYIVKNNSNAPTLSIETSTDGTNWSTLGETSTTSLNFLLNKGERRYIRCKTNAWGNYVSYTDVCNTIHSDEPYTVGGNIMSLLYGSDFTGEETAFPVSREYVFYGLFAPLQGSYQTPNNQLTDASQLLLPVKNVTRYSYARMFYSNPILTSSPVIMAETIGERGCMTMFYNCSSLNQVTCMATDVTANYATLNWVNGVAASGTFYKNPNMSDWPTGTSGIPDGWTVVDYQG